MTLRSALDVSEVASRALQIACCARFVGPLLDLGNPRLVVGAQQFPKCLDLRVHRHALNPLAVRPAYPTRTGCPRSGGDRTPGVPRTGRPARGHARFAQPNESGASPA